MDLVEYFARIKRHESEIYIRAEVDGKWENISLAEADPEVWGEHLARWLVNGIEPCYVRENSK